MAELFERYRKEYVMVHGEIGAAVKKQKTDGRQDGAEQDHGARSR